MKSWIFNSGAQSRWKSMVSLRKSAIFDEIDNFQFQSPKSMKIDDFLKGIYPFSMKSWIFSSGAQSQWKSMISLRKSCIFMRSSIFINSGAQSQWKSMISLRKLLIFYEIVHFEFRSPKPWESMIFLRKSSIFNAIVHFQFWSPKSMKINDFLKEIIHFLWNRQFSTLEPKLRIWRQSEDTTTAW